MQGKFGCFALLLGAVLATPLPAVAQATAGSGASGKAGVPTETAPVKALWVDKDLSFTYMGFTTHYSCDGIRDKVAFVLKELGARPGYKVTVNGCVNVNGGPEIMPRVRVRAALPQEATPELVAELAKGASKRELAARANGKATATSEATAQFPATWRAVRFAGRPNDRVEDGDCELMEQLVKEVLVPMGARMTKESRFNCVPHQLPLNAVDLTLEVLSPPLAEGKSAPEKT